MSQNIQVLNYLKDRGPITPNKARTEFGVERLAAVIYRLRNAGNTIVTVDRRSFTGRQYAEYHLAENFSEAKGPIRIIA